ncbi:MAG: hypothetical protein R3F17_14540, partial [Planctomycetota bacterium]
LGPIAVLVVKNLFCTDWLCLLAQLAPPGRLDVLSWLLEREWIPDLTPKWTALLLETGHSGPDDKVAMRLRFALNALGNGQDAGAIQTGLNLASDYAPWADLRHWEYGSAEEAAIRKALDAVDSEYHHHAIALWVGTLKHPSLVAMLQLDWELLDPESAGLLLQAIVHSLVDEFDESVSEAKVAAVVTLASEFLEAVLHVEIPYRRKAIHAIQETLWMEDNPGRLRDVAGLCIRWIRRCARGPFQMKPLHWEPKGWGVLEAFWALWQKRRKDCTTVGDAAILLLERACLRKNDHSLIGRGLQHLVEGCPELLWEGFEAGRPVLYSAAKALGCLSVAEASRMLDEFQSLPLIAGEWEQAPLSVLANWVQASLAPNGLVRLSAGQWACLRGEQPWPQGGEVRARSKLLASRLALQLAHLEAAVLQRVAGALRISASDFDALERHALLLHLSTGEHRRILRRLLQDYFAGRLVNADEHPVNQRWIAAQRSLHIQAWLQSPELTAQTSQWGLVTLRVERDLLRVLRLGTAVGSCLGLGGGLTYSAAAVALDINKQVVFATDTRGKVLARQILALSEDGVLHCHEVYGQTDSGELPPLFHEFDRKMAEELQCPIHNPDQKDQVEGPIALLLSKSWWEDGTIAVEDRP